MSRIIYRHSVIALAIGALSLATLPAAQADAVADALANYKTQGAGTFDAQAGARRWSENFTDAESGKPINCASCHHQDLRKPGQHIRTLKPIEPMAPSANPQRLTDVKKIEKWFLRNCKGTWARACTPQEKGDFLVYIQSQ
ncbi:MAG: DUF1924 domain-containing protein [Gammaproteobacteria bacterium]|nr:DUF1924 domain-containing protein [Gammaproteobacteria bacterium]